MNQYDMEPIPPEDREKMRHYIIAGVFALVALAISVFMLSGCSEHDPMPTTEERLHGAWERNWQGFEQTWYFDDGLCIAHSIIPAQPVQEYFWYYTIQGDTLTFTNLATSGVFRDEVRAVVAFDTDSTAFLYWLSGINYHLKRI